MIRIAILASGNGTNAENIIRRFSDNDSIEVALVISNRAKAGVIDRAKALGIETLFIPNSVWDNNPQAVVETLKSQHIDLVVLAGFMHYVDPLIVKAFKDRIINIHPSLLPAYGGKGMYGHHVHEAVIAAHESHSGVTVHVVTEEMDKGEIILQEQVSILPEDTPETLEAKIHPVEYDLYPRAIEVYAARLEQTPSQEDTLSLEESPVDDESPKQVPSPEQQWAEALHIPFDPSQTTPPPIPHTTPDADATDQTPGGLPQGRTYPYTHQPGDIRQGGFQPGAMRPGAPLQGGQMTNEPMPKSYLALAVIMTVLCCVPAGIVAIIYAARVSSHYYKGDFDKAKRASENAQLWIIISFTLGILWLSLNIPLSMILSSLS